MIFNSHCSINTPKTPTTENDKTLLLGQQSVVVTNHVHQQLQYLNLKLYWIGPSMPSMLTMRIFNMCFLNRLWWRHRLIFQKTNREVETLLMDARTTEKYLGVVVTVQQKVVFVKFERDTGQDSVCVA